MFWGKPNIRKLKRQRNVKKLIPLLQHRDVSIQIEAITALGDIGYTRSVETLLPLLESDNPDICAVTATALGKIGDTRAIDPLVNYLNRLARGAWMKHTNAIDSTVEAILRTGQTAMIPFLRHFQWDSYTHIRTPLLNYLRQPLYSHLVEEIIKQLPLRQAIMILSDLKSQRAIPDLVELLALHQDGVMGREAQKALKQMGWKPTRDIAGAWYYIIEQDWAKCEAIGMGAIRALQVLATDENRPADVRVRAKEMLRAMNALE